MLLCREFSYLLKYEDEDSFPCWMRFGCGRSDADRVCVLLFLKLKSAAPLLDKRPLNRRTRCRRNVFIRHGRRFICCQPTMKNHSAARDQSPWWLLHQHYADTHTVLKLLSISKILLKRNILFLIFTWSSGHDPNESVFKNLPNWSQFILRAIKKVATKLWPNLSIANLFVQLTYAYYSSVVLYLPYHLLKEPSLWCCISWASYFIL